MELAEECTDLGTYRFLYSLSLLQLRSSSSTTITYLRRESIIWPWIHAKSTASTLVYTVPSHGKCSKLPAEPKMLIFIITFENHVHICMFTPGPVFSSLFILLLFLS